MNMLANLSVDENINNETDVLGGGGVWDSDLYEVTVDMAYLQKSRGGALGVVLTLKHDGREHRETVYVTSGDEKGNKNYYEKDGQKHYLPGFNLINSLCLLTVGKNLSELTPEKKVIKVYDFDASKEVNKEMDVLTALLDQKALVGIKKVVEDKRQKGDDGKYYPTGETREKNELDKVFRASDKKTTAEIRAQAEEAVFYEQWQQKWAGKVHDKSTGKSGNGTAGAPSAGRPAAAGTARPNESLFS